MQSATCKQCNLSFEITDEDLAFLEKVSPVFNDKRYLIPSPTLCPYCRNKRRAIWKNSINFYNHMCGLCQRPIVSSYPSSSSFPVYCQQCFWGDAWDPTQYGRDFDFSRSFFQQFNEMYQSVPHLALYNDNGTSSENCEYTDDCTHSKNCYCNYLTWFNEGMMYSFSGDKSNFCCDVLFTYESQYCYECIDCNLCHSCLFVCNSQSSHTCMFGYDLKGCSNCFMCYGLRNKKYCIENKEYTPEEYKEKMSQLNVGNFHVLEDLKTRFREILLRIPRRPLQQINCENCYGDDLLNDRNVWGFDSGGVQDSRYVFQTIDMKNCMDLIHTGYCEWCYESLMPDHCYQSMGLIIGMHNVDSYYSAYCRNVDHVFGSTGLKRRKYCIFNKQYSKEDYEVLVGNILTHMQATQEFGEFFPASLSPFAYNESLAGTYYPVTKEEALAQGWSWKDQDKKDYKPSAVKIPESISGVSEDFTKELLACEHCGKNYRIVPQELAFYKNMNIPIPHRCFDCRHGARMKQRNARVIFDRACAKCSKPIKTSYAPERPEIVYCEECYMETVY